MRIPRQLYDEIVAHALEDAPNECCGLVGTRDGEAVSLHRRLAYVPGDVTLWPNLTGGVTLRQFPPLAGGVAKHVEFVTTGSDFQKTYGTQGIGSGRMPGFGQMLSARQIDEIVIYERSL